MSGTSIGAINGAIIAGSKSDNPVQDLEDFWMELAESSYNIIPDIVTFDYDDKTKQTKLKTVFRFIKCSPLWCSKNVYSKMVSN